MYDIVQYTCGIVHAVIVTLLILGNFNMAGMATGRSPGTCNWFGLEWRSARPDHRLAGNPPRGFYGWQVGRLGVFFRSFGDRRTPRPFDSSFMIINCRIQAIRALDLVTVSNLDIPNHTDFACIGLRFFLK